MIFDYLDSQGLRSDLIKIGEVSSVNYEACTARVVFGDEEDFISNDLQVIQKNTLNNCDVWLPEIGEDVICLFIPNGEEDGFILGSVYADEVHPPESGETKRYVKFKDGTQIEYDWESHELKASFEAGTEISATKNQVNVSGSDKIIFDVPEIEFKGKVKITKSLNVSESITADMEITANALTPATSVNLSTHIHQSAVGPSSPPTPGT